MREWASEADLAAYDQASAETFGRAVTEASETPRPWRDGPAGVRTQQEYDDASALTFGRGDQAQMQRQVAETDRQIAAERAVLEKVVVHGWPKVIAEATGEERQVAVSASRRTGGKSAAELLESGRRSRWAS